MSLHSIRELTGFLHLYMLFFFFSLWAAPRIKTPAGHHHRECVCLAILFHGEKYILYIRAFMQKETHKEIRKAVHKSGQDVVTEFSAYGVA